MPEVVALVGDPAALAAVVDALATAELELRGHRGAAEAEQALRGGRFAAVIVDDAAADSATIRRLARERHAVTVVVWLHAASSGRVAELLDAGAVDALDPTMSQGEIVARVRSALRRRPAAAAALELGGLRVDAEHGEATWQERDLALTARERELLHVLAEAAGRTLRRETIYRDVWGFTMARGDRTVDVNVKRLRGKLASAGADVEIRTQPGVGYRLELSQLRNTTVTAL